MEKIEAKKIVDLMVRLGGELNSSLLEVQQSCNEVEFTQYRKSIAHIMGYMLVEIINPIVRDYPDLKPSELE